MSPSNERSSITPSEAALALLTRDLATTHNVLPLHLTNDTLHLLTDEPWNLHKLDTLERITNHRIHPTHADTHTITHAINTHYPSTHTQLRITTPHEQHDPHSDTNPDTDTADIDNDTVHNINVIISTALERGVSDIHLEPTEERVAIRYRIDGHLVDHESLPRAMARGLAARIKVMGGMDIAERRVPQDGRIAFKHNGSNADMRVSSSPTIYGERIVMRILQRAENLLPLEQLGFSSDNLERFTRLIEKPYGMLLVTGPTGSGKSFTLFSALKRLRRPEVNILTIEDPVEYELPGIAQAQVNNRAGFSFPRALRAFLRQDPDIIMVGEIRDTETARVSIDAALTGHLVLATLHTNDAPSAPERLVKMGIEPYAVAGSLIGVIAQRLVRRICQHCRHPTTPQPLTLQRLESDLAPDTTVYAGAGCKHCNGSGYRGRLAIHELMLITPDVQDVISDRQGAHAIRDIATTQGMRTLRDDGIAKALQGATTLEEVLTTTLE